jgi:lipid-A-disaccharide synthase-like uncharacterized protein
MAARRVAEKFGFEWPLIGRLAFALSSLNFLIQLRHVASQSAFRPAAPAFATQ